MSRVDTLIAKNRRALHDYEILETYEAGIVLTGTEVCSLRENNCQPVSYTHLTLPTTERV